MPPKMDNKESEDKTDGMTIEDLYNFMKTMKDELTNEFRKTCGELNQKILDQQVTINKLQDEVMDLKIDRNEREQRSRNYSLRIFNLPVPSDKSSDPLETMEYVYDTVLQPILKFANVPHIPSCFELLEFGHLLKSKSNQPNPLLGTPASPSSPIIVRFFSRSYRLLILRNKKKFFESFNKSMTKKVFITEDLTGDNYKTMKTMLMDPRVENCFSMGGHIKFILKNDKDRKVKIIKNIYDNIDNIIR